MADARPLPCAHQVPDYYEVVKEPIDLQMILNRIDAGDYYITLEARCACVRTRRALQR